MAHRNHQRLCLAADGAFRLQVDPRKYECRKRSVMFRTMYDRRLLPFQLVHASVGPRLKWFVIDDDQSPVEKHIQKLAVNHYLPYFFEGLCECESPYKLAAVQAVNDVLDYGIKDIDTRILPRLVDHMRNALLTRMSLVVIPVISILIKLIGTKDSGHGKCIMYYMDQLMAPISWFENHKTPDQFCIGGCDCVTFTNPRRLNIEQALSNFYKALETTCGYPAFVLLKSYIPTYDSFVGYKPGSDRRITGKQPEAFHQQGECGTDESERWKDPRVYRMELRDRGINAMRAMPQTDASDRYVSLNTDFFQSSCTPGHQVLPSEEPSQKFE